MIMKKIVFALSMILTLAIMGCNGKGKGSMSYSESLSSSASEAEEDLPGSTVVSEVKTLENGKTIVFVDGKPFKSIGVQLRTDALMNNDGFTVEECEVFFAKAKELGVNTMEIPVEWKDIEIDKDVFDFSYVDKILEYTNKYDLKTELLWFGTNMCGDTHSYSVPEYILCDGKIYPKLDADRTGEFWAYYGIMWFMDFGNDNLIARESNAITKMMNHIYNYDKKHDEKHPVVSFQVLNEADIFARFRLNVKNVISPTTLEVMTYEEAWEKLLKAYDAYGKAVKKSKYVVYTRANLAASTGSDINGYYGISSDNSFSKSSIKVPPHFASDILALEGIDAVGDDTYTKKINEIKAVSYMYGHNLSGNFSHIAENAGDYSNISSLIIAALSQSAGYNIYDLVTPPFFIKHSSSLTVNQGICELIDGQIVERSHFKDVQKLIAGINKCSDTLLTFNEGDFVGFNVNNASPLNSISQNLKTTKVGINFQTSNGGYGFAVNDNNHMDIYVVGNAHINFNNINISSIRCGQYINNEFEGESIVTSNSLDLEDGKLYRVDFSSYDSELTSNYWETIGGAN